MAWSGQGGGGGPWGGGSKGNSPWGRGPGGQPPDIEGMLRRGQDRLRKFLPGGGNRGVIAYGVGALILLWAATGIYKVNPEEVGVVLRFGKVARFTQPGLNYHLPMPIESVLTPAVTRINKIELGYRSGAEPRRPGRAGNEESLMLTGDENIIPRAP
jgi:membrane protease subunit HflK